MTKELDYDSIGEDHGLSGERVKVRALDVRITIAAHLRTEVVNDNKEDVGLLWRILDTRKEVWSLVASEEACRYASQHILCELPSI